MALAKEIATDMAKQPKHEVALIKKTACRLCHVPNEETRQAIMEARAGIGLTRCKDMDEFRRRLLEE